MGVGPAARELHLAEVRSEHSGHPLTAACARLLVVGTTPPQGNTTLTTSVGVAFIRHYAAYAPTFSRRPYVRETHGAVVVRVARGISGGGPDPVLSARVPCGGPDIRTPLTGNNFLAPGTPFAEYRVSFSLAGVAPTCYEPVNITLSVQGRPDVTRTRTFTRAPPPAPSSAASLPVAPPVPRSP